MEETREEVTIKDNLRYLVRGLGTCNIKLESSITIQLQDVLYRPIIKTNLVSISSLEDSGYIVSSRIGKVLQYKRSLHLRKLKL